MLLAIRRASSLVSNLAADLRPGSSSKFTDLESHTDVFDGPRRRDTAISHLSFSPPNSSQWLSLFFTTLVNALVVLSILHPRR